jgi:capsular exopolysaccharide synthesis family protein
MGLFRKAVEFIVPLGNRTKASPLKPEREAHVRLAEDFNDEKDNAEALFDNKLWDPRLKISTDPMSPFFESFRRLRVSILYPTTDHKPRTFLVTSAVPNEGKGFICANLGIAISQDMEHHALIVDADFRRPSLAQLFGLRNEFGLVDYLQGNVDLSFLIRKKTGQPKLSIIPCGTPPPNPSELIGSSRMVTFINELKERYQDRIILFDSPPSIVASETSVLAKQLDGVILVIRHGAAKKEVVREFLDNVGREKIYAVIYNACPDNIIETFLNKKSKYSYYHYYKPRKE